MTSAIRRYRQKGQYFVAIALIVLLGVVLVLQRPQFTTLGSFERDKSAEQAALSHLSQMLKRHPFATRFEISWDGPLKQKLRIDNLNAMRYDRRKQTLMWRSEEILEDGTKLVLESSFQNVSDDDIHQTRRNGQTSLRSLGSRSQRMIQNASDYVEQ